MRDDAAGADSSGGDEILSGVGSMIGAAALSEAPVVVTVVSVLILLEVTTAPLSSL